MTRLVAVCICLMILIAGCSGASVSDGNGGSNVVTYVNESDNTTISLKVDHAAESYDISIEERMKPPYSNTTVRLTTGVYCKALQEATYNYNGTQPGVSENTSVFTRTENGETTTVKGLPSEPFADYTPGSVEVTAYTEDKGRQLGYCSVTGENSTETEFNVD